MDFLNYLNKPADFKQRNTQIKENKKAPIIKEKKLERQKGNSLLEFPDDYTVIDLETTGFAGRNSITEIGCIKYRNRKEESRFETLVRPDGSFFIPHQITVLTGITAEMLRDKPHFSEISDQLWDYLQGEILVGHNVHFDINCLYDNFYACDGRILNNDFVDTLRLSRRLNKGLKKHTLEYLCRYYGIENSHHRAVADCDSTHKVLEYLREG